MKNVLLQQIHKHIPLILMLWTEIVIGERRAEFPDSTELCSKRMMGTMFRISNQTAPRIDLQLGPFHYPTW